MLFSEFMIETFHLNMFQESLEMIYLTVSGKDMFEVIVILYSLSRSVPPGSVADYNKSGTD